MASQTSIHHNSKEFDTKAGVKGLVDAGIHSIPEIFVRPADDLAAEGPNSGEKNIEVPIIDLTDIGDGNRRKEVENEVRIASAEWGFFRVVNHGIPSSVLDEMIEGIRLFNEQDLELKKEMQGRDNAKQVQFSSFDPHTSKTADWRDTLTLALSHLDSNPDPSEMPAVCRQSTVEYIKHVKRLGETLFELLSEALGLRPDHLSSTGISKGCSIVSHYYPACPQPELALGIKQHSDAGLLALLLQNHIGGLQVLHDGQWFDVSPIRGSFVVNIGDLLQILSNDKFKSVKHRVTANRVGPRISVACFFSGDAGLFDETFGPIKELISETDRPRYKEFLLKEYLAKSVSDPLGDKRPIDYYKL